MSTMRILACGFTDWWSWGSQRPCIVTPSDLPGGGEGNLL